MAALLLLDVRAQGCLQAEFGLRPDLAAVVGRRDAVTTEHRRAIGDVLRRCADHEALASTVGTVLSATAADPHQAGVCVAEAFRGANRDEQDLVIFWTVNPEALGRAEQVRVAAIAEALAGSCGLPAPSTEGARPVEQWPGAPAEVPGPTVSLVGPTGQTAEDLTGQ